MASAVQLALMVGPLGFYLYVIALWQSGRRPRIIPGPADLALLLVGISGLVVFGPIGRVALGGRGRPTVWGALMLLSALGLLSLPWMLRAARRLVVYNADPDALDRAVRDVLEGLPGRFERTLRGYEDREGRRGVWVETSTRLRTGVVEAFGSDAEALVGGLRRGLRGRLHGPPSRPSAVAWTLLGACLALLAPVLIVLLTRPQARQALRALMERLHGG